MSFGVDAVGGLVEKLKQLNNDTQNHYESFIDSTQLYKKGKIGEKEYFARIGDYLIASSALNLLAVRVIIELKTAVDKGSVIKSPTGGSTIPSSPQPSFGIGGFVDTGGQISGGKNESYDLPMPQEDLIPPVLKPIDMEIKKPKTTSQPLIKNCPNCNASLPVKAKFCNKCGNPQ